MWKEGHVIKKTKKHKILQTLSFQCQDAGTVILHLQNLFQLCEGTNSLLPYKELKVNWMLHLKAV